MSKFSVGDHVSWNSEAGRVTEKIIEVHHRTLPTKVIGVARQKMPLNMKLRAIRQIMSPPMTEACSPKSSKWRIGSQLLVIQTVWMEFEENVKRWYYLIGFVVSTLGGGLLIGFLTAPGSWYAALAKPTFSPPNWLFAPAWSILYVLIAVSGWRTFERAGSGLLMRLWWVQLALNFLWSPVFFSAHAIGSALAIIFLLLAAILAFIAIAWRRDHVAAWLFVPYAAWVLFASTLNAAVLLLN